MALILDEKARLSKEDRAFIYFRFQGVCKPQQNVGFLGYGQFLTEYMAFAKQLSESRPLLQRLPIYLTYPTQL